LALGLLLAGFPLLGDPCLCVLRRWRAGQPIFQPHRLHLYQRLQMAAGRCKGPAHSKHGAAGPQDGVDGAKEPKQASQLCPSGVATSKAISADGGSQQMDNESRLRRLQRAFTPHVV
jgi:hypothetical protein